MKTKNYLDYNATSPFSSSVKRYLEKGDFPFGNPASLHAYGQAARKSINSASEKIFSVFGLPEKDFDLVYHSGATEGISLALESLDKNDSFFYCKSDHPAVLSAAKKLEGRGCKTYLMGIDENGDLKTQEAIELIKSKTKTGKAFINFLVVNNESGVYWPIAIAEKIKNETGAYVHVDATQLPGKIFDWNNLSPNLDAYTFSAHKFGALKGVGFSFFKKSFPFKPVFEGGGQQGGFRGGTENAMGIETIPLALMDLRQEDLEKIKELRDELEEIVNANGDTIVVGANSKNPRAVNTLNFLIKDKKADLSLIHFDMAGLAVSSGSACSAGSVEPSNTLLEMGYGELAKNGIRISLGPDNLGDSENIKRIFQSVLAKL